MSPTGKPLFPLCITLIARFGSLAFDVCVSNLCDTHVPAAIIPHNMHL